MSLRQYTLLSFQTVDTKLKRFLPKYQLTQRKLLRFGWMVSKGRKWRGGRVGNWPPSFWQNRRRCQVVAWLQRCTTLLLAHPVLGSHLRPCELSKNAKIWLSKSIFYFRNHPNLSHFFSLQNTNLWAHFLLLTIFDKLLEWCPIFDSLPLLNPKLKIQ